MSITAGDIITHKTTELQQRATWRDIADRHWADALEYRAWLREFPLLDMEFSREDVEERWAVAFDMTVLADRKADGAWWL